MKKIIIFDYVIAGHHIEYIHNIYDGIKNDENEYFFVLPKKQFESVKNNYNWDNKAKNISFYLYSISDDKYLKKEIKKIIRTIKPTDFFFIMMQPMYRLIPLLQRNKIKVSGIHYYIYLYEWKTQSFLRKCMNVLYYSYLSKSKYVSHVFILNDKISCNLLNHFYHTDKFLYLADPVQIISNYKDVDSHCLQLSNDSLIISHLGSLDLSKGTLDIIRELKQFDLTYSNNYHFIFAGKISDRIKNEFYSSIQNLENQGVKITVIDKFLSLQELNSILNITSLLLCPYQRTAQSSGIIGYAAQYQVPVFVYNKGLLAKLVKRNKLGIVGNNLLESIYSIGNEKYQMSKKYLDSHTSEKFVNEILLCFERFS